MSSGTKEGLYTKVYHLDQGCTEGAGGIEGLQEEDTAGED